MKKIIAMLLAVAMLAALCVGCAAPADKAKTDSELVQERGKLIVGVTVFEPMDYQDKDGNWKGFDADLAKAFAKELGVEAEFVIINWTNKVNELNDKNIDLVWNGMTLTDEVKAAMSCSNPYLNNAQVVVMKSSKAANYTTKESLAGLKFAAEKGSAGADQAMLIDPATNLVKTQAAALMEVSADTSDATVIDLLMANAMIGEGTAYPDLTDTVELTTEQYGIGLRKGSDLLDDLNAFLKKAYTDGTMETLANTYKIRPEKIVEQK